ncbi:UNVERIFIED_ORG: hypothetical protein QOE_3955 [Clostridioides difficile F501]
MPCGFNSIEMVEAAYTHDGRTCINPYNDARNDDEMSGREFAR